MRRELEWDPTVDADHLGVTARTGSIVLMGAVASHAEMLAAVKAAERVYGVRTVADEIEVMLPGGASPPTRRSQRRSPGSCTGTRASPTR